jgi:thiol-disulfide isomerase/thioredoxin
MRSTQSVRFGIWIAIGVVVVAVALWGKARLERYEPQEYVGPALPAPAHVARVGDVPEPIVLHAIDGRPIAVGGRSKRRQLIHFWASWCLPCVAELPSLQTFQAQFGANEIDLITVALDDREHAADIVARQHLTLTVLVSDGANVDPVAALGSGQGVVPFNVLIDVNGRILRQTIGTTEDGAAGILRWARSDR